MVLGYLDVNNVEEIVYPCQLGRLMISDYYTYRLINQAINEFIS
jgi:hypothetical protein